MRLLEPLRVGIESGTFQSAKVGHYDRCLHTAVSSRRTMPRRYTLKVPRELGDKGLAGFFGLLVIPRG